MLRRLAASGSVRTLVYRLDETGPKPRKIFGLIWNSKIVVFYMALFTFPSIGAFMYTGGRTQLSREELLNSPAAIEKRKQHGLDQQDAAVLEKERLAAVNKVLFQSKDEDPMQAWVKQREAKLQAQRERASELEQQK